MVSFPLYRHIDYYSLEHIVKLLVISGHTETPGCGTHPHVFSQRIGTMQKKRLILSKKKHSGAGLPCSGFSSVAGRGNLSKEAPAKVTNSIVSLITY